uniref:Uncharacterized protein n=1 Tax=Arundo donax TaxID=35708 RepID=A0A0A9FZD8_ARUDO
MQSTETGLEPISAKQITNNCSKTTKSHSNFLLHFH